MRRSSKSIRIGDIVIYKHRSFNPMLGVVSKIELSKWGHQERVYIKWQDRTPANYDSEYGYSGMNIINHRSSFRLIRH